MTRWFVLPALVLLIPIGALAQGINLSPIQSLIGAVASVLRAVVPVLVTLGLAVFLWGLVRYLWGSGAEPDLKNAKQLMMWGLVILFVMVSVWGIIDLMQLALGINKNATGRAPQILYQGSGNTSVPYTGSTGCPLGTPGCYQ